MASHEQRLINKEHMATHTNLNCPYVYSSTLVIKLFKYFSEFLKAEAEILTVPVFFYMLCNSHNTPTFKTETLHLVSSAQLVKWLLL